MELERRYEELDIDGDGDVQDSVYHFHLPATQSPELDPDLDAPVEVLKCGTLTLSFAARRCRTWMKTSSRRSVLECPLTTTPFDSKHIDKNMLVYTRGRPFRFVLRAWFQLGTPASLKAERYAVATCMSCKYGCIDEETDEHVHEHVASVERGTCARKTGADEALRRVHLCIAALWYFAKLQRPADPYTPLESEWFGTNGEGDPMNRTVPLNDVDFNRFEVTRATRRCAANAKRSTFGARRRADATQGNHFDPIARRPQAATAAPRSGARAKATAAPSRFAKPRRVQKTRLGATSNFAKFWCRR